MQVKTAGLAVAQNHAWLTVLWLAVRKNYIFWLMLMPSLVLLIAFAYVPMFGIVVAFRDFNFRDGLWGSPWVGMQNFMFLFNSGRLWLLIRNTLLYNVIFIVTGTITALTLAIMISEVKNKYFKKLSQSIIFLPNFMSWVVIAAIFSSLVHPELGMLSVWHRNLGLGRLDIYSNVNVWYWLFPVLRLWRTAGFASVIYLAAIMGLDQECYESARLDGANIFHEIFHITLPMLRPTIIILTLLSLGGILRGDFDMFFNIVGNNGLLFRSTDIIDTYVFRSLMVTNNIGMASAAGFFQSVFGFFFIIICNKLVKIYEPDYALF